jgi:hypothetical protein
MSDARLDLPSPTAPNFEQRVREAIMVYLGRQGSPLDRGLTIRDLVDAGVVSLPSGFVLRPGVTPPLSPAPGVSNGEPDLTPPPVPTGFAATGGVTMVLIEHDAPVYPARHLRTRVYGVTYTSGPAPTFNDAVELSQFTGAVHAIPSNPATTWRLWIKWESVAGVLSDPAGGTTGLSVTTAQDVSLLLDALAGQITESELAAALNGRIDLIDGSGVGSVDARIAAEALARSEAIAAEALLRSTADLAEADARAAALLAESQARSQAIAAEAQARTAEIAAEALLRANADTAESDARVQALLDEAAARTAAIAVEAQARADAIQDEVEARVAADAAEAAARIEDIFVESKQRTEALEELADAVLRGVLAQDAAALNTARDITLARNELTENLQAGLLAEAASRTLLAAKITTDLATTTALISSESVARADAVSAEAVQRDLLAAQFRGNYTGDDLSQVASGLLFQEKTARAGEDDALAQSISLLEATIEDEATGLVAVAAAVASEQSARVAADEAIAEDVTTLTAQVNHPGTGLAAAIGLITDEATTRATADTAEANARLLLDARVVDVESGLSLAQADILSEQNARVDGDGAIAEDLLTLSTQVNDPSTGLPATSASLQAFQTAQASANEASASDVRNLRASSYETDEDLLRAILAGETARVAGNTALATARSELTTDIRTGLLAEAAERTTLAARLDTDVASTVALVTSESVARATALAAEASERETLAVQFRGDYEGSDINAVTSGLIFQERTTRASQDAALSQQITLLSAGAGEQFDWATIWYFDTTIEGWTGNGTPTVADGFLRPANQASGAYVESPTISVDGNKYRQIRLRARKVGTVTWGGFLYWKGTGDTTWDNARRVALTEPTWDVNNVGLVTANPTFPATVIQIRVDLSSAQTVTDYMELDWVAVGRPSPGASSAQLLEEQTVRASETGALTTSLNSLSATINNETTGLAAAHSAITAESSARVNADSAITSSVTALTARVGLTESGLSTAQADILTEAGARAAADTAEADLRLALSAQVNDVDTGLPKTRADLVTFQEVQAGVNEASAQEVRTLKVQSAEIDADVLSALLLGEATKAELNASVALARQELNTAIVTGLEAESTARITLAAVVNSNAAAFVSEQVARATADESMASSFDSLTAVVYNETFGLPAAHAAITNEQIVRASETEALASSITTINSTISDPLTGLPAAHSAITAESTTRATETGALTTTLETLEATVSDPVTGLAASHAAIVAESSARADAVEAEADARELLAARVTTAEADILTESGARVDADEAIVDTVTTLSAQVNDPVTGLPVTRSQVQTFQEAQSTLNEAVARDTKTLRADAAGADETALSALLAGEATREQASAGFALIRQELQANITEGLLAEASARQTIASAVALNAASIVEEQQTRATVTEALASDLQVLTAVVEDPENGLKSRATALETTTTSAVLGNSALADRTLALETSVDTPSTGLKARATALETITSNVTSGNSALASRTSALETSVDTPSTGLKARATALETITSNVTSGNSALASRTSALETSVDTPSTGLKARATALETITSNVTSGNAALASRASSLEATVNNGSTGVAATAAALSDVTATVNNGTTGVVATATRTDTLFTKIDSPTIGNNPTYAAVQTEITTRAGETGSLFAQYTVKVDANGYVSGFGLANTLNNGVPFSEFIIKADQFAIAPVNTDNAAADGSPFFYRTAATTINGVSVPAGAYMKAAFIHDATITNAKIANLAVDNAKIADLDVAKLNAGVLKIGSYIQSSDYTDGASGVGYRIDRTSVVLPATSIRGQLVASQINTNGLTIRDTAGNPILTAGASVADSTLNIPGNVTGVPAGWLNSNVTLGTLGAASASDLANKLNKNASDILTAPITLSTSGAVQAGNTTNGVIMSPGGLVGYKAGQPSFSINAANGDAMFAGALSAVTGTFHTLAVSSTGYLRSGTKSYGSAEAGFVLDGNSGVPRFDVGNATQYIRWSGSQLVVGGDVITTGNLVADSVTKSYGVTYTNPTGTGAGSQTAVVGVFIAGSTIAVHSGGAADGVSGSGGACVIRLQRYEGSNPSNKVNLTTLFGPIEIPNGEGQVFLFPPYVDVIGSTNTYTYEIYKDSGDGLGKRTMLVQEFKR